MDDSTSGRRVRPSAGREGGRRGEHEWCVCVLTSRRGRARVWRAVNASGMHELPSAFDGG